MSNKTRIGLLDPITRGAQEQAEISNPQLQSSLKLPREPVSVRIAPPNGIGPLIDADIGGSIANTGTYVEKPEPSPGTPIDPNGP